MDNHYDNSDYSNNRNLKIKKTNKKDKKRELSPILLSLPREELAEADISESPARKKQKIVNEELGNDKYVLISTSDEDVVKKNVLKKKRSKLSPNKNNVSTHRIQEDEIECDEQEQFNIEELDNTLDDQHHTEVLGFLDRQEEIRESQDFYDGWNKEDIKELFRRIEGAIPKNDTLKYNSRVLKLDWDKIKFNSYSATDCCERWKVTEKKLRGYRLLNEVLVDAHAWADKPWTDFYGSVKKNRHPDQPKKPLSSYMLFYMAKKDKFSKKYPHMDMNQLTKLVATKFNSLPEEKKDQYNKAAADLRENYNSKMEAFVKQHPEEAQLLKRRPMKYTTGCSRLSKPLPPFKLFYQDKLKQLDGIGIQAELSDILNECRNKWKNMSDRKKMSWIRSTQEAEDKYMEELKLYASENPYFQEPPYKSVLSKQEKEILKKFEGKPEKPPNSGYSLFTQTMLREPSFREKVENPKERMQQIGKLWKELPKIDREEYSEKLKHLLQIYERDYATYLDSLPEDKRSEELASSLSKKKAKCDSTPSKKLKQTTMLDYKNLVPQTQDPKELRSIDELLQLEPAKPPDSAFILLRDEYITKGLSKKKAKKAWAILSKVEKRKYQEKLQTLKDEYITNFHIFLTNLKPDELSIYSSYRAKNEEDTENTSENDIETVDVESKSD